MPVRINSNWRLASLPTSSVIRSRSRATICDALATESLGKPVAFAVSCTLPGASAQTRLLVNGMQTTVRIRLRFSARLGQQSRVFGIQGRNRSGLASPPSTHGLGKLPFDGFEGASRGGCQCWVKPRINHLAHAVHRISHRFRIVPGDIFGYRLGVDLAARFFQSSGQPFGLRVYFIGNGDRRFHTRSITGCLSPRKRPERRRIK
jgi:hypothetical protein